MKPMTKAEYEELIRKKPSLRPTEDQKPYKGFYEYNTKTQKYEAAPHIAQEAVKSQNTHNTFVEGFKERLDIKGSQGPIVPQRSFVRPPTLVFTIPGQPVGKPRQTQSDRWKKRPCVMRYRAWADKARAAVPNGASLGIYRQISFIAYLEFPKSYSVTKRAWLTGQPHMQKPDVDNILKGFDALFPEDKFIWKVSGEKRWDDGKGSRVEVELR